MKRKHGFLLFLTGCVPGCGQMYQGYMKRGLSLMMLLCSIFILAMFLSLDYLLIFFLPLFLYSFFDSWNLRNLEEQGARPEDAYLFGFSELDVQKFSALFRQRNRAAGWLLVVLGIYILFDTFVGRVMHLICEYLDEWWLYDIVMRDLPRMAVTVGIIALGVWFIRGPKPTTADEDIPVFVPPMAETMEYSEPEAMDQEAHDAE